MTNPRRIAFFITALALNLTEQQLYEILLAASQATRSSQGQSPQLSKIQQTLCDWISEEDFRAAADHRLVAERDAALKERDEARDKVYSATLGFENVKQRAGRLLSSAERFDKLFKELNELLKDVPPSENR